MAIEIDPAELRRQLQIRGWSTGDLAARAGISRSTISRCLHGGWLTAKSARAVAEALRRHPADPGSREAASHSSSWLADHSFLIVRRTAITVCTCGLLQCRAIRYSNHTPWTIGSGPAQSDAQTAADP
jgi:lambda repressor-like predicted transcriptional regulator